jgi:DNA-binding NtrC family response regulator
MAHPRREPAPIVLDQFLEDIERELIVRALQQAKGNRTKAARLLGLPRARLHRRLEHFKLSR